MNTTKSKTHSPAKHKSEAGDKTAHGKPELPTLYAELKAAGIEVANHESDLYFADTPESRAILDKYPLNKQNAQRFTNQAAPHKGEAWFDVPFAFIPFWDKVQRQSETATACQKTPNSNAYQRKFMRESANLQSTKQMQERQTQAHFNHVEAQRQAQHSPLPSKWHDCEVAEKQIKLLQQQANHAQALADALREMLGAYDDLESGNTITAFQTLADAREVLANWEGAK